MDSFRNSWKLLISLRRKTNQKKHVLINFAFYQEFHKIHKLCNWFPNLLINLWFFMRQEAKNNTTKLSWYNRRPGRLMKEWKELLNPPQFIFPAQEILESKDSCLTEEGRVVWISFLLNLVLGIIVIQTYLGFWYKMVSNVSDDINKVCRESK